MLIRDTRLSQAAWGMTPLRDRLRVLRRLRALIVSEAPSLAAVSAGCRKRPLEECLTSEVLPLTEACRYLEQNAERILKPRRLGVRRRPLWLSGVTSWIHREPLGLILIISSSNYPLMLPGVQILQALAAGNAVWVKPAPGGTAPVLAVRQLLLRAGLDPNLVSILPEDVETARSALASDIDKVLLTGSASTGEKVLSSLAGRIVPAVVELSGRDPVLVRADADLELVALALAFGLRLNSGETCLAPRRVLVAHSVVDRLEAELTKVLPTVPEHLPPAPILTQLQLLVAEAKHGGAQCLTRQCDGGTNLVLPLVLSRVPSRCRLLNSEIFASMLLLVGVSGDDEAVEVANNCPYALGATVFTRDLSAGREIASRLRGGVISLNDLILPTADPRIPFGGRGRSGFGVTRGEEGLRELTAPKVITATANRLRLRQAFEPPRAGDADLFCGYLRMVHGQGLAERWAGLRQIMRQVSRRRRKGFKYEDAN